MALFMVLSVFTTLARGEFALDHLAERIGVLNEEARREAGGKIERQRDVDEDLAVEVLGAGLAQHLDRHVAAGALDDHLAVRGGVAERSRLAAGAFGEAEDLLVVGAAGAHHHVVAERDELCADRLTDFAGSENPDLHRLTPLTLSGT